MRVIMVPLMSGLAALATGCATITGSETQPVSITTETHDGRIVQSARCTLRNDKGAWSTVSPGFVNVGRSAEDLVVECRKTGLPDGSARAISRAHGGMWGNIIIGGGIGAIIDHNKGTGYDYPNTVPVRMGRSIVIDRSSQSQVQEEPIAPGTAARIAPENEAHSSPPKVPVAAPHQTSIGQPSTAGAPPQAESFRDSTYSGVEFPAPQVRQPPPSKVPAMSFEVERLARMNGCTPLAAADLLTEPGPVETFRVRCSAGSEVIIKCEYRKCRTLN